MRGKRLVPWMLAAVVCAHCASDSTDRVVRADELLSLGERGRAAGFHVLLVTVDTLRADHVGCYGAAAASTPTIDALAASGLRFDQAVASAPITLVSHASLMTALDPTAHGVRLNGTFRLGPEPATLAETLAGAGYATGAAVGAFVLDARFVVACGFDYYDDEVPAQRGGDGRHFSERPGDRVTDAALAWLGPQLDAEPDRPFFFWAHYYDPHVPYAPPAPYDESFADRPYDGEIAFADAQVGRLIDFLKQRGVLDETLVVFAGDHGEGLGDHGEETHQDLIYDSTMRVPLIVSNPGLFGSGGTVADRVAGLIDVFPTIVSLLGLGPPTGPLDGRDLFAEADPDRAIYLESLAAYLDYGWAPQHGLRRLHDKLILGDGTEYYDLRADPGEQNNRYANEQEIVDLRLRLERLLEERGPAADAREGESTLDPEELERLVSLGYVRRPPGAAPGAALDAATIADLGKTIDRATALLMDGDANGALRQIEPVLREHPDASRALYVATAIFDALGKYREGEVVLLRALGLKPTSDGWVHLAWYAFQRRDWETFDAALAEAERLDPADGGIWISRGYRFAGEGRVDEAIASFERALEVDPDRSGAEAAAAIRELRERP